MALPYSFPYLSNEEYSHGSTIFSPSESKANVGVSVTKSGSIASIATIWYKIENQTHE